MKENKLGNNERFYLLVGKMKNWEIALDNSIWGFTEKSKGLWNKTNPFEFVAFYVTRPYKKIFGFGQFLEKTVNNQLLWQDEKTENRSIWKYKIKFKIIYKVDDIKKGLTAPKNTVLASSRPVVLEKDFFKLVKDADKKWNSNIMDEILSTKNKNIKN